MITTEEAIAMAKEALNQHPPFVMTEVQQLTALCNLVRQKTLEEAAAFVETEESTGLAALILRDMAAEGE